MKITTQSATHQYNEFDVPVSYWDIKHGAWITLPEFKNYHPFETEFSQPFLSLEDFKSSTPNWLVLKNELI